MESKRSPQVSQDAPGSQDIQGPQDIQVAQDTSPQNGAAVPSFLTHDFYAGAAALVAVAAILTLKTAMECHSTLQLAHYDAPFLPSFLRAVVVWYWWAAVALILWILGKHSLKPLLLSRATVLLQVVAGCCLAAAHMALLRVTMLTLGAHWPTWGLYFRPLGHLSGERFSVDLTIYGFIYISCALIRLQVDARTASMQKNVLERQLSQAQLQALQMQLEPHFLFNTLNSIASLVDLHRNDEASLALGHLNTILRTALERGTPAKVPFHEELKAIESYLAIQKLRFSDRLEVRFDTSPEALDGLVPSFLLQPIVENAIHHGISRMKRGGVLETTIRRVDDKLQLRVRDNGNASGTDSKGHGIGLRNTRERLTFFYPNVHRFKAGIRPTGGYEVFIEIPYEKLPA